MALVLGVREGESVFIDDRKITLQKILTPVRYKVLVEGGPHQFDAIYEITAKERVEILPDVYLSAGVDASMDHAKLAFDAPRNRVILRQRLYEQKQGAKAENRDADI